MRASQFFTLACIASLTACASYEPVPVVTSAPVVQPELVVAIEEAPAAELPVAEPVQAEPSFKDHSPNAWTVQIAALKNLDKMTSLESDKRIDGVIRVPTNNSEHGELHTVLVGVYDSLEDAQQVVQQLPNKVAGDDPWIRSVESVQAVMR